MHGKLLSLLQTYKSILLSAGLGERVVFRGVKQHALLLALLLNWKNFIYFFCLHKFDNLWTASFSFIIFEGLFLNIWLAAVQKIEILMVFYRFLWTQWEFFTVNIFYSEMEKMSQCCDKPKTMIPHTQQLSFNNH